MHHPTTIRRPPSRLAVALVFSLLALGAGPAAATGEESRAGPPEPPPREAVARDLFGAASVPADLPSRAIGSYSRGCLAGARQLVAAGANFQVMRPSRNRAWGHPALIAYVERLAAEAPAVGWKGLLVGDLAQPRGGPMTSGHASHQVGLDVDVWLLPMPDGRLTEEERESLGAPSVLAEDQRRVDPARFTDAHARLLRRAASDPAVARIFVHPAIKRALCAFAGEGVPLPRVRPAAHAMAHGSATAATGTGGPTGDGDGAGDRASRGGAARGGERAADGGPANAEDAKDATGMPAAAGAGRAEAGAGGSRDVGAPVDDDVEAAAVAPRDGDAPQAVVQAGPGGSGVAPARSADAGGVGADVSVPPEVWLRRIRPWYGHHRHFHVRLACPEGEAGCRDQAPPPEGTGCGAELDWWFTDEPWLPATGGGRRQPARLGDLPEACTRVLLSR